MLLDMEIVNPTIKANHFRIARLTRYLGRQGEEINQAPIEMLSAVERDELITKQEAVIAKLTAEIEDTVLDDLWMFGRGNETLLDKAGVRDLTNKVDIESRLKSYVDRVSEGKVEVLVDWAWTLPVPRGSMTLVDAHSGLRLSKVAVMDLLIRVIFDTTYKE